MKTSPKISAIVAMAKNRVMGRGQKLPWHLPEDLKRFRLLTLGHPVVMGRKTFESIGKVLPNRRNIIISRQPGYFVSNTETVASLEAAFCLCEGQAQEIFVIGGAEIYRLALPFLDRIYLTLVNLEIPGDTFFPEFSINDYQEISREEVSGPISFSFLVLERKI